MSKADLAQYCRNVDFTVSLCKCISFRMLYNSCYKSTRTATSMGTVVLKDVVFKLGHSTIGITSFLSIQDTDTVSVISDAAN